FECRFMAPIRVHQQVETAHQPSSSGSIMKPSPSVEAGADTVDLNSASCTAPRIIRSRADGVLRPEKPPGPSTLYRAEFWRLGVQLARRMPHGLLRHLT